MAKTPNLDRLARSGVRFDRAYCQFPLCNPSRAFAPVGTLSHDDRDHRLLLSGAAGPRLGHAAPAFPQSGYEVRLLGKVWHFDKDLMKNWFHEECPETNTTRLERGREMGAQGARRSTPACSPI